MSRPRPRSQSSVNDQFYEVCAGVFAVFRAGRLLNSYSYSFSSNGENFGGNLFFLFFFVCAQTTENTGDRLIE